MQARLPWLHLALLLALGSAAACSSKYRAPTLPGAALGTDARVITVTVDRCDCVSCRVVVFEPINGIDGTELFNRANLTVGVEEARCDEPRLVERHRIE